MFFGGMLRLGELPGKHARCANVARFASLNNIVQRFHCLFDWRLFVVAVDLVEIDII